MNAQTIDAAIAHLRARDRRLGAAIGRLRRPEFHPTRRYFESLIEAITSQQLSGAAAATIFGRFKALYPGKAFPKPEDVLSTPLERFRSAGVSRQKAGYVLDLAAHVADGRLQLSRLSKLDDQEIIDELVAVKGVGVWTAQMFLMFTLGRPDVLAPADLGLQKGMQRLYGLPGLPKPAEMQDIAARRGWSPYRTVACWYLWRVAEEPK